MSNTGVITRNAIRARGTAGAAVLPRPSVCIITQNFSFGGMEVHTLALMGALLERGYTIELIANRYYRYDAVVQRNGWGDRVSIVHTDLDGILYGERSDRTGWRRTLAALRSRVLIFPKGNYTYGQIGFLRECRRAFERIVFIEHLEARPRPIVTRRRFGIPIGLRFWWYKRKVLSRVGAAYADAIVAVSAAVKDRLITDIGYPARKVKVVRNGVASREYQFNSRHREAVRRQHAIPAEAFVFGMLTRLTHEKGLDIALQALARVDAECPATPFWLIIAGEGNEADGLETLAASLGIEHRVKFIGFVSRPDELLSAYDVILFSSRREGLPLGLLQGMATGCVPIVTNVSGMPEAVDSPSVGWVVPPDDPVAIAGAMIEALALDSDALASKRHIVARRIRDHFDVGEANRRIVDLCEQHCE